jgi:hypothetical protein
MEYQISHPGLTLAYPGGGLGDPCTAPAPYGFVGKIANGVYNTNPTSVKLAVSFDDTFVEWVILPGYNIPTWMNACGQNDFMDVRSHYFFSNFVYDTLQPKENAVVDNTVAHEFGHQCKMHVHHPRYKNAL